MYSNISSWGRVEFGSPQREIINIKLNYQTFKSLNNSTTSQCIL